MNTILPELPHIDSGVHSGRVPLHGYQRSFTLVERMNLIEQDPIFQRSQEIAADRILTSHLRRANIYLILKYFLPSIHAGNIVEFGTFRGGMAMMMASICKDMQLDTQVYALDTFEGMPEVDKTIDYIGKGWFNEVNYEEIVAYAASKDLKNLHFVRGLFQDTAASLLPKVGKVSLVHIDCDIRSACAYAYDVVKPYLVDGAYIIFDDATDHAFIGATEVVEDLLIHRDNMRSEQINPHFVFRHNLQERRQQPWAGFRNLLSGKRG